MPREEQPVPRHLPFLDQNDPLIKAFWDFFCTDDVFHCLWVVEMNVVAATHAETRKLLPLESPDSVRQKGVMYLWQHLQRLDSSPMDLLLKRLRVHLPDLAHITGKHLQQNIEEIMLRFLRIRMGELLPAPFRWRGEYLTPDNPIRIGAHVAGHTHVAIPDDVSGPHVLQVQAYVNAWRPAKPRGRHPKPSGAPSTPRPTVTDEEALRAWELKQQGATLDEIRQALFPDEPLTSEKVRRRVVAKVRRRLYRGRLLASKKT